jgi:hypothetical protein
LPRDFLAGLVFFLGHLWDLLERGLKLGLKRKEPAWYGLLLSACKASRILASSPKRCVREGGHSSKVGRTALERGDSHTRRRRSSMPWLKVPAAMSEPTLAEALADVDEVLLGVLEDLEEGIQVLGRVTVDGVVEAWHEGRLLPQWRKSHFATSYERQTASTHHVCPESSVLEGLLALEVGLHMKKGRGELKGPKEGCFVASVRVVTFRFMEEMDLLHSLLTVGRVGSQLGRWSMSSTFAGAVAGTVTWRMWPHCSFI